MKHYLDYPSWISSEIIKGFPVQWYGIFYVAVIVLLYFLFLWQLRKRAADNYKELKDSGEEMLIWMVLAGLIGARVFYALFDADPSVFLANPFKVLWPFEGKRFIGFRGLNYFGGLSGAVLAFYIYSKAAKINGLMMMDMIAAAFPLGFAVERIGVFFNGELYGRICTKPWGIVFPGAQVFPANEDWVSDVISKIGMQADGPLVNLPRHPTQFYEMTGGIILWILLWFVFRKMKKFDGFISGSYLVIYGIIKFITEYFRMPGGMKFALRLSDVYNPPYLLTTAFNLTTGQVFSLIMIISGTIMLLFLSKKSAVNGDPLR